MRLELHDAFEDVDGAWSRLAATAGNVFATPELAEVWWRHFGGGRAPALAVGRRVGGVAAVVPLYLWRTRPLRVARFVGHRVADQLGPLCAPGGRDEAAALVREALAELRADVLLAEQLPRPEGWAGRLGGRVLVQEGSPVLRLGGRSWDELLGSWSSNFRGNIRRRERGLAKEGEVRFRLADDPERLGADLGELFRLHRLRWAGTETAFAAREAFHRDFAPLALARGWLRLWLLELDGRAVAAWYGFRFAAAESYYQLGRDPSFDRLSVGLVLLAHTIRAAAEDGMSEYRFLRGDEPYKYRFTQEDGGLETVGVATGPAGRAALAGLSAARGARRTYRRAYGALRRST